MHLDRYIIYNKNGKIPLEPLSLYLYYKYIYNIHKDNIIDNLIHIIRSEVDIDTDNCIYNSIKVIYYIYIIFYISY